VAPNQQANILFFYVMWDPQRLTTLWTFTAIYMDSFTLLLYSNFYVSRQQTRRQKDSELNGSKHCLFPHESNFDLLLSLPDISYLSHFQKNCCLCFCITSVITIIIITVVSDLNYQWNLRFSGHWVLRLWSARICVCLLSVVNFGLTTL
jgi:hypothetical protein